MVLRFKVSLCLCIVFLFLGCTDFERENPYDPGGDKYRGGYLSSSSRPSSSSSKTASSSSSAIQGGISYGTLLYQGQNYKTVQIGSQVWMAENLNYNVSGSVCYNNNSSNCATYGRLYNWATARTICPSGWHLPSDAEWTMLTNYVESQGGCSSCAGTRLKATSGWSSNGNGTDNHGFSALPGGSGYSDGDFSIVGNVGYWWSSTEYGTSNAWYRSMYYYHSEVGRGNYNKSYLYSIRCLRD